MSMLCDLCKQPIERSDPYAITEYGRTHVACLRVRVTHQILGPRCLDVFPVDNVAWNATFLDPIYVYRNLTPSPVPLSGRPLP